MYGPSGVKAYTASVMNVLSSAQLVKVTPPKYHDEYDHQSCSQARYQAQHNKRTNQNKGESGPQTKTKTNGGPNRDVQYEVPTYNRFAKLGDYFPKNL